MGLLAAIYVALVGGGLFGALALAFACPHPVFAGFAFAAVVLGVEGGRAMVNCPDRGGKG